MLDYVQPSWMQSVIKFTLLMVYKRGSKFSPKAELRPKKKKKEKEKKKYAKYLLEKREKMEKVYIKRKKGLERVRMIKMNNVIIINDYSKKLQILNSLFWCKSIHAM